MQVQELKINYIKNDRTTSHEEDEYTLARFISLFAQIGFDDLKNNKHCNNVLKIKNI